jgi:hypothetical protein
MKNKQAGKRVFFSIADNNNLELFKKMEKSFHYFHPKEELKLVGQEQLTGLLKQDPQFFYRATPVIAWNLFKQGYTEVIKIDADSLILGDISHTWNGVFDVGVVNNSNPREMKKYPVTVWNLHPLAYVNAGYVVMKSPQFVEHWLGLCTSNHFEHYQMREQDLQNILVFYMNKSINGPYEVNFLDAGKYAHGLVTRGYEPQMVLRNGVVILPGNEEWNKEDKTVKIFHYSGGNITKGNYRLIFSEEVCSFIDKITI